MARIIYREDFIGQRELFTAIKAKHDADGAGSPLTQMLADKGIDLTADETAGNDAATAETGRLTSSRKGEDWREKRDLKFNPVFTRLKPQIQFMKSYLKPNVHELGDWGVTVDGNKIVLPAEFAEKVQLFKDFKAQHDALLPNSPLSQYLTQHTIDLTTELTAVTDAEGFQTNMVQVKKDSEDDREDRQVLWGPVEKHCHVIGDFLKKLYNNNPQQLGYWGFTVDESPREPKFRISKVKPAAQTTTDAIVIGSTFTNLGQVELHVYKGKSTTGTFVTVPAGEMTGMIKGFSTITVVNPSTTITGIYRTLVNR